jgi:hypothetical protein
MYPTPALPFKTCRGIPFSIPALFTVLALLFSACRQDTPDVRNSPANDGQDEQARPDASEASGQPGSVIALSSEGLQMVNRQTGASRALGFGTEQDPAIATLTAILGQPQEQSVNPECGAGPLAFVSWGNGLTTLYQDGRFAGWSVTRPPGAPIPESMRRLTTMSGVGIGATRQEIESTYVLNVMQTSLGTEFDAGGLYGLLTSDAADAEVTSLWAGTVCIFR